MLDCAPLAGMMFECNQQEELVGMQFTTTKCAISVVLIVVGDCFNQPLTAGENG
jgi:hypothetical protein